MEDVWCHQQGHAKKDLYNPVMLHHLGDFCVSVVRNNDDTMKSFSIFDTVSSLEQIAL